jgi:hypothetical protein
MKSISFRFFIGILFLFFSFSLAAKQSDLEQVRLDPVVMVKRMFQAIQENDLKTVRELMWPERFKTLESGLKAQGSDWKVWFALWQRYPVLLVSGPPVSTGSGNSYRIRVDYQQIGSDSVGLRQEGGRWYWDEN